MKIFGLVGIGRSARLATLAAYALVMMTMMTVGVTVAIMIEGMAGIPVSEMMLRQVLSWARTDAEIGGGRPYPTITTTRGRMVAVLPMMMRRISTTCTSSGTGTTPRSCDRAVRLVRRGMRRGIMELLRIIVIELRLRRWSSTPRREIVRVARRWLLLLLLFAVLGGVVLIVNVSLLLVDAVLPAC